VESYTIEEFWKRQLGGIVPAPSELIKGWSGLTELLQTFTEAPLTLNNDLSSTTPETAAVLLISAPGAVGKTTLAKQIAAETGAVYIDLAAADPVGGNTISGGLAKSGLYDSWRAEKTTLLIDGLDEARLRVTQEAFEAFLVDLADLTRGRRIPAALFGRTGAIQDSWIPLQEQAANFAILEIGFYDPTQSREFAKANLAGRAGESAHRDVQIKAVELLLSRLREEAATDGDRFSGYAPVLQAVVERVVAEDNPAGLIAQIEKGERPVTLQTVVAAILDRERSKLTTLPLHESSAIKRLYSPEEQLSRLVARVYGLEPPSPPKLSSEDAQLYTDALETWLPEHPFLDGGQSPSSAVFEAVITAEALRTTAAATAAIARELARGSAANPFLAEFYFPEDEELGELPAEHIGIVYASLRARLTIGDHASLLVEGAEEGEEEEALRAEVEIFVSRVDSIAPRILNFQSEQVGTIKLGKYIEDVEVFVPLGSVEIGTGTEALLVAPVLIQAEKLSVNCNKLTVENGRESDSADVFLESDKVDSSLTAQPVIRGNAKLSVAWPGARAHPWTAFATEPTQTENPSIDEGLRRLRKFVTAFRSHSKGNLARYRHKIEHERMIKGTGAEVLAALREHAIITLDGSMYYLDPSRLGAVAGATYAQVVARQFSGKTIDFVRNAIEK
jgi:hypothetical protein